MIKNKSKNEIKRIILEKKKLKTFLNQSPKTSRNQLQSKFPQPGSFAATMAFKSTVRRNSSLFESDCNFVYKSPRNKNSLIKMRALNMTNKKETFSPGKLPQSPVESRNKLELNRLKTTEPILGKVYNKVEGQAHHIESTGII